MLAQDQNYPPAPKLEDYESPEAWWEALLSWFMDVTYQVKGWKRRKAEKDLGDAESRKIT